MAVVLQNLLATREVPALVRNSLNFDIFLVGKLKLLYSGVVIAYGQRYPEKKVEFTEYDAPNWLFL